MYKCHKQYTNGGITVATGLVIAGTGVYLNQERPSEINKKIILAGLITSVIGSVVVIDSHKWIGRASLTGITLTLKL